MLEKATPLNLLVLPLEPLHSLCSTIINVYLLSDPVQKARELTTINLSRISSLNRIGLGEKSDKR